MFHTAINAKRRLPFLETSDLENEVAVFELLPMASYS